MLLALLAAGAPPALSQWTKAMGQRGFVPGASFESSGIESVNMINGNVLLQIPLASMPVGRGGMGFDLKLIYNAALWDTTANYFPLPPDSPYYLNRYYTMSVTEGGGWGYNFSYRLIPETRAEPLGCCTYGQASGPNFITPKQAVWKFRLRAMLPDGSLHVLYLANTINDPYWQNASMQDQDAEEGGGWYAYAANGMASDAVVGDQRSPQAPQSLGANATYYTLDGTYIRVEVEAGTGHWWQWQDRP
jgi:hypothetical protein